MSYDCRIDYMAPYALQGLIGPQSGPYEVHEMLHHYQMTSSQLADMTAEHTLFDTSMLEAVREIGDMSSYVIMLAALKAELTILRARLQTGAIKSKDKCGIARSILEGELYLEDSQNIHRTYSELVNYLPKNSAKREAKFNSVLNDLSGGTAKAFLTTHGCKLS